VSIKSTDAEVTVAVVSSGATIEDSTTTGSTSADALGSSTADAFVSSVGSCVCCATVVVVVAEL